MISSTSLFSKKAFNTLKQSLTSRQNCRNYSSDGWIFRGGDYVLLRSFKGNRSQFFRLAQNGKTDTHMGVIVHADIIGKRPTDIVNTSKGKSLMMYNPSLDEYVRHTPRLVTPIYGSDASFIVSKLDINVIPPEDESGDNSPLEILEAGTGHGSLTLHLAQAIYGANGASPAQQQTPASSTADQDSQTVETPPPWYSIREWQESPEIREWKSHRKAVIHTVDLRRNYSLAAQKTVAGFRRGVYLADVDFHVSSVSSWVTSELKRRQEQMSSLTTENISTPFLSHVILDMPDVHFQIPVVASAIRRNGVLAIFAPNITQILACFDIIKQHRLPLWLENTIEVGMHISDGRQWEISKIVPRSMSRPTQQDKCSLSTESASHDQAATSDACSTNASQHSDADFTSATEEAPSPSIMQRETNNNDTPHVSNSMNPDREVTICRPVHGNQVHVGGFLGIWRRIRS